MTDEQHKKTRIFTVIVVLSNVLGNSFLSRGMRGVGVLLSLSPLPYIQALFNPWVALGATLLVLWLLSHMAIGYVLVALSAKVFLHEHVSPWRWAGIALIVAGVTLVSRTTAITTARPSGGAA
jgi:drug/metabolite transporter (DMT)-like permease